DAKRLDHLLQARAIAALAQHHQPHGTFRTRQRKGPDQCRKILLHAQTSDSEKYWGLARREPGMVERSPAPLSYSPVEHRFEHRSDALARHAGEARHLLGYAVTHSDGRRGRRKDQTQERTQ